MQQCGDDGLREGGLSGGAWLRLAGGRYPRPARFAAACAGLPGLHAGRASSSAGAASTQCSLSSKPHSIPSRSRTGWREKQAVTDVPSVPPGVTPPRLGSSTAMLVIPLPRLAPWRLMLFSVLACGVIAPEICPGARLQAPPGAALRRSQILAQALAIRRDVTGHFWKIFNSQTDAAVGRRIDDTLVQCRSVPTRV